MPGTFWLLHPMLTHIFIVLVFRVLSSPTLPPPLFYPSPLRFLDFLLKS